VSFANARNAPLGRQYACGSSASRLNGPRSNEVVCFRLDGSLSTMVVAPVLTDLDAVGGGLDDYSREPKGNLDPTGQYFSSQTNLGGNRPDAVIVRVPAQVLVPPDETIDEIPPTVTVTSPANGANVSGTITLSADAADNIGVVGVQFKLDNENIGSEIT